MKLKSKTFIFFSPLILLFLIILISIGIYYFLVISYNGEDISEESIKSRLASESLVLASDRTPIGSILSSEHRRYVPYDEIPERMIKTVVAAEDAEFFNHHGFNFTGLLRALLINIKERKIVQGGSTITMQTAENLFFRKRAVTFGSKIKEFIWTLRLEHYYKKQKILEFYLNQFFVTGTGRGIGIASEFFFNKKPKELSWLECGYITAVLKGPGLYNPFNQQEENRTKIISRIKFRLSYVLNRLAENHFITPEEAKNLRKEIEKFDANTFFTKGKIYFENLCLVEAVREEMESKEISDALRAGGIDDYSQSGVTIVTSINKDIQTTALSNLRMQASYLKTALEGYSSPPNDLEISNEGGDTPREGHLYKGEFVEVRGGDLLFKLGNSSGFVDKAGREVVENGLKIFYGSNEPTKILLEKLIREKTVLLEFREQKSDKNLFNLLRWTGGAEGKNLDGGALVIQDNKINTMVGGFFDRDFNRASMAKRQFGSVFKPVLFACAFELGWRLDDELLNERALFRFQDTFYFPKPDHKPRTSKVSIIWAGVLSENLASVWLLYNLPSRLSKADFFRLAAWVGLAQKNQETYEQYSSRIRDHIIEDTEKSRGIMVDRSMLEEAAFSRAREKLLENLIFEDRDLETIYALKKLHYGRGFEEYMDRENIDYNMSANLPKITDGTRKIKDLESAGDNQLRSFLMRSNYLRMIRLRDEWKQGKIWTYTDENGKIIVSDVIEDTWTAHHESYPSHDFENEEKIFMDGAIPLDLLNHLETDLNTELKALEALPAYSEEVLYSIPDFKIITGLLYVNKMSKLMGIKTPLEPVLSFPLGPTAITLPEIISVYSSLTSGYITESLPGLIQCIENPKGKKLYERQPVKYKELLVKETVQSVREILYHVISHGTGREANNIAIHAMTPYPINIHLPVMGKTGTANEYRNSSFVGAVPFLDEGGLVREGKSYILGTYLGYDGNEPMKQQSGWFRVTGARGSLPLWIEIAQGILEHENYDKKLDRISLNIDPESSLIFTDKLSGEKRMLDSESGLPDDNGSVTVTIPAQSGIHIPD